MAPIVAAYWTPDGVLVVYLDKTRKLFPATEAMQEIAAEHTEWAKRCQAATEAAKLEDAVA